MVDIFMREKRTWRGHGEHSVDVPIVTLLRDPPGHKSPLRVPQESDVTELLRDIEHKVTKRRNLYGCVNDI